MFVWLFLYFLYGNGKGKGDIYCGDAYVSEDMWLGVLYSLRSGSQLACANATTVPVCKHKHCAGEPFTLQPCCDWLVVSYPYWA